MRRRRGCPSEHRSGPSAATEESVRDIRVAVSRSFPSPVRGGRASDLSQSSAGVLAGVPSSPCLGQTATV